jgi:cytochrome c oxidase subunit I+III
VSGATGLPRSGGETPVVDHPSTDAELERLWADPKGLRGILTAVQNDRIGRRLLLTGFFFLLLGGSVDSLVMRLQLAVPENTLIGPQLYSELFTNHGSVTMFLVILPIFEGFAILVLPLILGTREMPFPRLGAFSFWTFLLGGLLYYSSTLFQLVPDAGWFVYTPLSRPDFSPDLAIDFWVLGLGVAEVGAIAAAIEIIIGVVKLRARHDADAAAAVRLGAARDGVHDQVRVHAADHREPAAGARSRLRHAVLRPHPGRQFPVVAARVLIFGHPEAYIQFVPATGIVAMIVAVFARHRAARYTWLVAAVVGIGFLSLALWAHHMFATGLPPLVLSFFAASSMAIAIPAGVQIFSWLATIWAGKPVWRTPFLFVLGCSPASTWRSSRCTRPGCSACRGASTPTRRASAGTSTTCSRRSASW